MKQRNVFTYLSVLSATLIITACNKYSGVTNSQLSGHVYIQDPLSNQIMTPARGVTIYLNKGADTTTYILQVTTDLVGFYSLPSSGSEPGTLYTRFVNNNAEFQGSVNIPGSSAANRQVDLTAKPVYTNGLGITFENGSGPVPNYPFRLYTSHVAAMADSVKFANVNTKTNISGQYIQYNTNPFKYYITAIDSINGQQPELIDSVTVAPKNLTIKVVKIK